MAYDRCAGLSGAAKLRCQLDKATANVGALLAAQVEGRVATELDPRLAHDQAGLVAAAKALLALYEEMGVKRDKLIWRLPATWAGIQVRLFVCLFFGGVVWVVFFLFV
jgi:transaldolase